jgi:hypothetical protein
MVGSGLESGSGTIILDPYPTKPERSGSETYPDPPNFLNIFKENDSNTSRIVNRFVVISVADPKQKFRIRGRIRIRPADSFESGSRFESGSETGHNFLFMY